MSEGTHTRTTTQRTSGAETTTLPPEYVPVYPLSARRGEMYFLSHRLTQLAMKMYAELDSEDPQAANQFFETFGPGNIILYPDRPHERFSDYERLLELLLRNDSEKYRSIHKGTPFYFMSWLAFDLRDFEKALFYMDGATSEDIRQNPDGWLDLPAGSFLTLRSSEFQVAQRTIETIRSCLNRQIERFNSVSGLESITLQQFIDQFVRVLVQDVAQRTIISALYVYLLEFEERYRELRLRSTEGGSIAPFIIHLFRGALIFESLLKHLYSQKDDGDPAKTLGQVFYNTAFRHEFVSGVRTSADSLRDIVAGITDDSMRSAFTTTARLRNTTGHNLVWDDEVFQEPSQYEALFHQEINALLYLVSVKFCH